jgi:hypothetical protein
MVTTDLSVHSQTELGLNIYVAVSDVRDGVTKTHTVVADTHTAVAEVRRDVANTHAMVSDISRKVLGSPEGDDNQRRPVSHTRTRTMSIPKCMLTVSQTQSRSVTLKPNGSSVSYLHLAYLVNHLHRRRGLVSGVMS